MLIEEPQTTETQGIGEFKRLEGTLFLSRFTDEELRFKLASSLTLLSSRTEKRSQVCCFITPPMALLYTP